MYYSQGFLHTNFQGEELITVSVFNTKGQLIKTGIQMPSVGVKKIHLQSGIYFLSTQIDHQIISKKILVFE
jgi:hypothetical protein